jgi:L-fuculose-phosphate aldolase
MSTAVQGLASRDLRARVVAACSRMVIDDLSRGTSGNISARVNGGMLITPSGVPYAEIEPGMLMVVALDGTVLDSDGRQRVSTEWRLHARVLERRPDVNAIVHTHSPCATALACLRRPIPAFHYMVAAAGGADIPCTPYATFGTDELAGHAADALAGRNACLLANHGVVAVGRDVETALALAAEIETLAHQYTLALQAGEPVLLTTAQMNEALRAFAEYRK